MSESKGTCSRIIIGTVLILAGALIHWAFTFGVPKPSDAFDLIGYVFAIAAYGIVANLFILLGLKYYFGQGGWFERSVAASLRQLILLSVGAALVLAVIFLVIGLLSLF